MCQARVSRAQGLGDRGTNPASSLTSIEISGNNNFRKLK
jgi:hypothetical protein